MTKIDTAFKALPKGRWISRQVLVNVLNETDLRTVRRLREDGWEISVRKNDGVIQYRRA